MGHVPCAIKLVREPLKRDMYEGIGDPYHIISQQDATIEPELKKLYNFPVGRNIRILANRHRSGLPRAIMLPQLEEEDQVGNPLTRDYLRRHRCKPVDQKSMREATKVTWDHLSTARASKF